MDFMHSDSSCPKSESGGFFHQKMRPDSKPRVSFPYIQIFSIFLSRARARAELREEKEQMGRTEERERRTWAHGVMEEEHEELKKDRESNDW